MREFSIIPHVKINLEHEIKEFLENNFPNFGEFCTIEKYAMLADDILFFTDKKVPVKTLDDAPLTDYVMIIESRKTSLQSFDIFFFNEDEIDEVVKLQKSFSKDEIKYMEVEDDDYEDYEDINDGIFSTADFI